MNKQNQEEFKKLIEEGTLDALRSGEGQKAVVDALRSKDGQGAIVNALGSKDGQGAIVNALGSKDGQEAIKTGTLEAMKSEEGKDVILDVFVEAFHEVVVPAFEDQNKRIKRLEKTVGLVN